MTDNINFKRIQDDIVTHGVVLYMNGTPMYPRCCSSAMAAHFLDMYKIPYVSFNLMEEISLLPLLKEYTGCHMVPMLFIGGQLAACGEEIRKSFQDGHLLQRLKALNLIKL